MYSALLVAVPSRPFLMPELERLWGGVELFSSPPQLLYHVWKTNKAEKIGFGDMVSLYFIDAPREALASAVQETDSK